MRLIFVHGWALGSEIWDFVSPRLANFAQARVDLGYFGAPRLPEPLAGDVLVGHSAGFLWGLRQRKDWAGAVAINSFSRFGLDAHGRGCVRPAELRAMRTFLARDVDRCVANFRAAIGAPPPAPAHAAALAEGLALLADFDAAPYLRGKPCLVLAAADDGLERRRFTPPWADGPSPARRSRRRPQVRRWRARRELCGRPRSPRSRAPK